MGTEGLTLNLGSINLSGDVWSLGAVSIGSTAKGVSVSVASDHAMTQTLKDGYGTLKVDADGVLTFAGGSGLGGEVSLGSNTSSLSQISFSAAVQTTIGANKADSINLRTVNTSSGKDTIYVGAYAKDLVLSTGAGDDFVSVSANSFDPEKDKYPHGGNNFISTGAGNDTIISHSGASIDAGAGNDVVSVMAGNWSRGLTLGAGKDTLVFVKGEAASSVNLQDYNFNDDLIQAADESYTGATLDNKGTLKLGYGADSADYVFGLGATNSLYLARVADKSNNTTVYATAEEDASKVVIDASTIKKEEAVVIDATSADLANITLGKASLASVALKAGNDAVDTIKIGDTNAKASVFVTNFYTDDVLSFTGLTFDKTTVDFEDTLKVVTLTNGKVSVGLDKATVAAAVATEDKNHVAKFNLNGTTLYATTHNNQYIDLTEETDLSKVLIKGELDAAEISGIVTSAKLVDLGAVNINNIDGVSLTADAVAGTSLIGTNNKNNGVTLDASAASDGVAIWTNNGEKQTDIIKLSTAEAADTLWFGTTDGKDSVTGFQLASDILYLHDATAMTADKGIITVGKASLDVTDGLVATEEIMQVQGAKFAGTFYVAGDFFTDADNAIKLGYNAGKVNYYAVAKDASVFVDSTEAINYTFLKDIDYAGASKANIVAGGSVASIDAGGTTSDSKVIIEGVANVTLGSGTNEVWVNGAAKDASITAGAGSDKIWFGASDKNVNVTKFDTESDVIALMGSIGEFSAKKDESDNVVISNASKKSLTLDVAGNVSLVDAAGAKYKLFVDNAEYTTNTDGTNIYLAGNLTAGSDVTGATNIVVEGANNKWGIASSAIVGKAVKDINMSGSSADFVLIGSANASNTITGGMGTNYLNGGGASKDTLNGVTGAVDYFYYGKEDGNDTLVNVGAEDEVRLYDIATTDLAVVKVGDDKTVITLNNDSKLTINGSIEGLTFVLTDGTYKYDSSADEKWVKQ